MDTKLPVYICPTETERKETNGEGKKCGKENVAVIVITSSRLITVIKLNSV